MDNASIHNAQIPFSKFKDRELREIQKQIIPHALTSNKKVVVLNLPTGVGKSLIGMMLCNLTRGSSVYSCSSKILQDQLADDFPESKVLKGRGNYLCNYVPQLTADTCIEKCDPYKKKTMCFNCELQTCNSCVFRDIATIDCNYYDQKDLVSLCKYGVLNTQYLINEINYAGQFRGKNIIVVDEADTLESIISNFISFSISPELLESYKIKEPEYVTKSESWVEWGNKHKESIANIVNSYKWVLKLSKEEMISYKEDIKEYVKLSNLLNKIELFLKNVDAGWIFDHKNGFDFSPIWLTEGLASKFFWNLGNKFVLMSGTMHNKAITAKLLGVNINNMDYFEADSPFSIQNRQIIYKPVVKLHKNVTDEEEKALIDKICETVDNYKNRKGIVHAVSYQLCKKIVARNRRFITHNTFNKNETIEKFYKSKDLIFVSPSSERGLDLKGDLGEFCIWAKVPFPNLSDKKTSARLYSGKFGQEWYTSMAAQSIVQGAGRIVRCETDMGKTYIFDSQFDKIIHYLPEWFKKAIVTEW